MCSFVPKGWREKQRICDTKRGESEWEGVGREWGGGKDLGMVRAIKSDFLDQLWKMK